MRLDELTVVTKVRHPDRPRTFVYWRSEDRAPDGRWVVVSFWAPDMGPQGYYVMVGAGRHVDDMEPAKEYWDELDELATQCVLFELWARRNWRQRLWRRLCDWTS